MPLPKGRKAVPFLLLSLLYKAPQVTASLEELITRPFLPGAQTAFSKDWKCRVKQCYTELSAGKQSSPPTWSSWLHVQEAALKTGSKTAGMSVSHHNQIVQPRLSSSPLISACISAWFGKYPEISRHKKTPRTSANANTGKDEMFACYHFPTAPSSADSKNKKPVC